MKIDTLLLSACGSKGICYVGVFDCLQKYKVITNNLQKEEEKNKQTKTIATQSQQIQTAQMYKTTNTKN